ncbi:MAG: hypothetical protein JWN27_1741 [Candidatus Eremiobacteraeota bacterium]|nr:hypothetical protein [Candidatus Eremiobacteraeota bacterium]
MSLLQKLVGTLGVAVAVAACGCARHDPTPLELADFTTRAVYDADVPRATTYFDARLRSSVTPRSVTDVSKLMHRYGSYQGVAQQIEISKNARYDFEALFSQGSMLVQMRLGEGGKTITAFRLVPNEGR